MIGPEHSYLHDTGRVEYGYICDDEAVQAFQRLCRLKGIIPALESSHAVAYLEKISGRLTPETIVIGVKYAVSAGSGIVHVTTVAVRPSAVSTFP